jgi:uncharacterized membrane protein YcjF (UPF0283 family)
MRWGRTVLGALMLLFGATWFLQGVRVLPGSFMTGSAFWAVTGAVVGILGLAVLALAGRRRA